MSDYEPLAPAIETWLDKPRCDLPIRLSDRVTRAFIVPWDSLTSEQRLSVAEQWDVQHDPTQEDIRNYWFEFYNRLGELDEKISQVDAMPTPTASDFVLKEEHLEKLRQERQEMEAELVKPAEETPAQRKQRLESWYRQEKLKGKWGALDLSPKKVTVSYRTFPVRLTRGRSIDEAQALHRGTDHPAAQRA